MLIPSVENNQVRANQLLLTPICNIQGSFFNSPYVNSIVKTRGVVFLDLDQTYQKGFFMQDENCDGDASTSDGIYVYLGEKLETVNTGDSIEVTGVVQEYYGMTEIQASREGVTIISSGNPLPTQVELTPPFSNSDSRWYFEARESMYVQLDRGRVVGPTDRDDRTWLVRTDLGIRRVFQDDPQGTGEVICVDDNGVHEIIPEVRVDSELQNISGALDYRFGIYCIELATAPFLNSYQIGGKNQLNVPMTGIPDIFTFSAATLNLADLFDAKDDPFVDDTVLTGAEYQRRLKKRALAIHSALNEPTFIAVQETENITVTQDLVNRPEILADYGIVLEEGPDQRGIDVALLYRLDQVQVMEYEVRQACTTLVDGLGPDGNRDVTNPQNNLTCDSNDDGVIDGNRLFSRPPLIVSARVCHNGCPGLKRDHSFSKELTPEDAIEVWLIINHWKSKVEDTVTTQHTLPRRIEQAHFVASLVQEILVIDNDANIIVFGDLNDYPDSQPLSILTSQGLLDITTRIDKPDRFTYNYGGVSSVLDYVLARLQPPLAPGAVRAEHINSDYPFMYAAIDDSMNRSSDHDPVLVDFALLNHLWFFPLVAR